MVFTMMMTMGIRCHSFELNELVFTLIRGSQFNSLCWVASILENTTVCFSWFSLIWALNHAPFIFLVSLLFKEFSDQI